MKGTSLPLAQSMVPHCRSLPCHFPPSLPPSLCHRNPVNALWDPPACLPCLGYWVTSSQAHLHIGS